MQNQNFEKFYYDKVATGEGCGCAERIIDVHEFNRLAGRPKVVRSNGSLFGPLVRLVRRVFKGKTEKA